MPARLLSCEPVVREVPVRDEFDRELTTSQRCELRLKCANRGRITGADPNRDDLSITLVGKADPADARGQRELFADGTCQQRVPQSRWAGAGFRESHQSKVATIDVVGVLPLRLDVFLENL